MGNDYSNAFGTYLLHYNHALMSQDGTVPASAWSTANDDNEEAGFGAQPDRGQYRLAINSSSDHANTSLNLPIVRFICRHGIYIYIYTRHSGVCGGRMKVIQPWSMLRIINASQQLWLENSYVALRTLSSSTMAVCVIVHLVFP